MICHPSVHSHWSPCDKQGNVTAANVYCPLSSQHVSFKVRDNRRWQMQVDDYSRNVRNNDDTQRGEKILTKSAQSAYVRLCCQVICCLYLWKWSEEKKFPSRWEKTEERWQIRCRLMIDDYSSTGNTCDDPQ